MEGILVSLNHEEKRGKVDTRNDEIGILTIYFRKLTEDVQLNRSVVFELVTSKTGNRYAKFISMADRNQVMFNTEDRSQWYVWGEEEEKDFIVHTVPKLGVDLRINPRKEQEPWVIDFVDYTHNRYADLKTQNTPFFTAGKYRYGGVPYDPAYTVTFNKKDYDCYIAEYPNSDIYFWVCWQQLQYKDISVKRVYGVWRAPFRKLAQKIQVGEVALHTYQHRESDDHNAKKSYLFNLMDCKIFERLL